MAPRRLSVVHPFAFSASIELSANYRLQKTTVSPDDGAVSYTASVMAFMV
jgi:hypothetical protein